jgi:hypothetical protein
VSINTGAQKCVIQRVMKIAGGGAGKIGWRELHSAAGNVIANVADGHQYHDRTADRVYRLNAGSERGLSGNCRSGHRGCGYLRTKFTGGLDG